MEMPTPDQDFQCWGGGLNSVPPLPARQGVYHLSHTTNPDQDIFTHMEVTVVKNAVSWALRVIVQDRG
jgi:hypothetical protein